MTAEAVRPTRGVVQMTLDSGTDLLALLLERTVTPRPDCQIWTMAVSEGYGITSLDGKAQRAHRVVWELTHGPIPDGMTIDHLCRVRSCINVAHMEVVSLAENVRRSLPYRRTRPRAVATDGRPRIAHCVNGHSFTPENSYYKPSGKRECRACATERKRAAAAARAARRAESTNQPEQDEGKRLAPATSSPPGSHPPDSRVR